MEGKRAPINTARLAEEKPEMVFLGALLEGPDDFLRARERSGQAGFVGSDTLPRDLTRLGDGDPRKILEAAGVKFLGDVEGDPLFQYVELPPGWSRKPTDHAMQSYLVDEHGRRRASIFYKAASYDRRASMTLRRRFEVVRDFELEKDGVTVACVQDQGSVVHSTEPIQFSVTDKKARWAAEDRAAELAVTWLNETYPDWKNPGAYWDE